MPVRISQRKLPPFAFQVLCPVFLALAPALAPAPARADAAADYQSIRRMADSPDPETRGEICRQILDAKPTQLARSFCDGYAAVLAGNDASADNWLDDVLQQQPDFSLAALLYGQAYESRHRLDRAEALYRRAIEVSPHRTDARFALGSLLLERGKTEDPRYFAPALEAFRQLTQEDPDSPDGWGDMGLVLTYMDRFDDAEAMYKTAISKKPDDPFLYNNLAALYARENRGDEAAANWRTALRLNPGYGPAVVELAALYGRTGRLADAISVLEAGSEAVQAPPWGPRIRRNLAFVYLRLGEMDKARAAFRDAAASGEDALSFLGLAHETMLEGKPEDALTLLESGAVLDSTLAVPFVRAWKEPLASLVRKQETPALARILARVAVGAGSDQGTPAASGKDATADLVAFVLEGWSFTDISAAQEAVRTGTTETGKEGYDSAPVPIQRVPADYPESAQEQGLEGTVQVTVTVDEKGRVVDASVRDCSAPQILCEAAERAARRWTFQPATRYGAPVRASVTVPFRFVKRSG